MRRKTAALLFDIRRAAQYIIDDTSELTLETFVEQRQVH
jgi:uncharacterized protein with HEPN domain